MKVIISVRARHDIIAIGRKIAEDNPIRALSFADELQSACLELASMSEAFETVGRRHGAVIRRKPHGKYLVLYEIRGEQVQILRVVHGARNYRKMIFRGN